jgi:ABC-type nitrate/sulfonate/bicarbonate transport system substrate-binding protein
VTTPLRIAVPDLISNSYFPAIAAVELGFFRDEGIEATVELLFPVTAAMAALRDGHLAFVAGAAHATLVAFPAWRGARLLASVAQHMYWFLVLRKNLNVQRGDVHALKGLRIGAAPGVDLGLRQLLAEVGLDPARDNIRIAPVPGASRATTSFGVTAARALEEGSIDGFWANGMGAELAVRRGIGSVVLDVRRGDGPPRARGYTFPALVATERLIDEKPNVAAAAVRAFTRAQQALRDDPRRAAAIGDRLFPRTEAELIAELIRRDAPFYNPSITPEAVVSLNNFAHAVGLLDQAGIPYDQVVATRFAPLWQ